MIFVTVGTDVHGFERLVATMDQIADTLEDDVVIQLGETDYRPDHAESFRFTSPDEIDRLYGDAAVVVAHAGAGTVIEIVSRGKPAVIVPRRAEYDEHVDDHQFELATAIEDWDGIFVVDDPDGIEEVLDRARVAAAPKRTTDNRLASFLEEYLAEVEQCT